jgi:AraC-like DNA-binding protein
MAQLRPSSRYRDRVMALIRQQLWQESAEASSLLDGVCEHLRLTRWTLNRHLREEGCHFSGLLERVRREEACRLLQDPALPLQTVGERLGFARQSSFTRFFQGGVCPLPQRVSLKAQPPLRRPEMGGEQPRQPVDEELDPGGQLAAMGIEGVDGERRRLPLGQDAHQLAPASRDSTPPAASG